MIIFRCQHLFTKILVPIDGSPNSNKGLQYAIDIAKKHDASITLIHVVERPVYAYYHPIVIPEDVFTHLKEEGGELLSTRKEEVAKMGLKVDTLLVVGEPSEQILKAAEDHDLIVIGSRGLGTAKSLLLGSISSKIAHHARKPVLIVRPD